MGTHHAGERAFVGDRERGIAQRPRPVDELLGMGGAAQEREVRDAMQLGVGGDHRGGMKYCTNVQILASETMPRDRSPTRLGTAPAFLRGSGELLVREHPLVRIAGPAARLETQALHVGGGFAASIVGELLRVVLPRLTRVPLAAP